MVELASKVWSKDGLSDEDILEIRKQVHAVQNPERRRELEYLSDAMFNKRKNRLKKDKR